MTAATAFAPIVWGSTYLVTTELLPAGRPLLAGLLRALPAGLVLVAITRSVPKGIWWLKAAVLGTLNIGGFFALLFVAAFRLPGGVAATLGAVQPLVAAGLAAMLLGERIRRTVVLAGVLGIVGVGLLVLQADAQLDALGIAAGLGATLLMASGVVLTKHWSRPVPLLAFTAWQLVAGGAVLLPVAVLVEGAPTSVTVANLVGFVWLSGVGTALAYALWFRGIQVLPVAQVTLLGLFSPIVAAILGWLFLAQALSGGQIVGMATIVVAVVLGQRRSQSHRGSPDHCETIRRSPTLSPSGDL